MGGLRIKAGSTMSIGCAYVEGTDADGDPVDLTSYTASCQLRSSGDLYAQLTVTFDSPRTLGTFVLSATAEATALWAVGSYACDIRIVEPSGDVIPTDTFIVWVDPSETEAVA